MGCFYEVCFNILILIKIELKKSDYLSHLCLNKEKKIERAKKEMRSEVTPMQEYDCLKYHFLRFDVNNQKVLK